MVRPRFIQAGRWEIKSFPHPIAHESNGRTVIRVPTARGFQHIVELDWADFGHSRDAEELAQFICDAVNK